MQTEPEQFRRLYVEACCAAEDADDPAGAGGAFLQRAFEERERKLREALEPFVRHGRACGALSENGVGPFWIMTDEGHRDVPASDFKRAAQAFGECS